MDYSIRVIHDDIALIFIQMSLRLWTGLLSFHPVWKSWICEVTFFFIDFKSLLDMIYFHHQWNHVASHQQTYGFRFPFSFQLWYCFPCYLALLSVTDHAGLSLMKNRCQCSLASWALMDDYFTAPSLSAELFICTHYSVFTCPASWLMQKDWATPAW